jgi:hypothetical protein
MRDTNRRSVFQHDLLSRRCCCLQSRRGYYAQYLVV